MKKWMLVVFAFLVLLVPRAGLAHEGHLHRALGTVAKIDGPHVDIKTTDGKSVTVMLDKETTITRGKDKLDATALKVGERVSVDYMEEKGMNMAHAVKLSTTSSRVKK
jgi:hypothetical protein